MTALSWFLTNAIDLPPAAMAEAAASSKRRSASLEGRESSLKSSVLATWQASASTAWMMDVAFLTAAFGLGIGRAWGADRDILDLEGTGETGRHLEGTSGGGRSSKMALMPFCISFMGISFNEGVSSGAFVNSTECDHSLLDCSWAGGRSSESARPVKRLATLSRSAV